MRVLTWNLFHGRDFPPDPALHTWRSRLLRVSERNATHIQVNRDLFDEFVAVLGGADWDFALLQESPPRWADSLAHACDADPHLTLTARNSLAPIRSALARCNPDLIASNEGGSNLTLVRRSFAAIVERRELELRAGPRPERRMMGFTRMELEQTRLCVANLHASAGPERRHLAEEGVISAAERADAWAGNEPLVFGGDLNLRPRESDVFVELETRFGLRGPTAPASLDHLLSRGLETISPPQTWAAERRELVANGLRIRLSDHAPVDAEFRIATPEGR